MAYKIMEERCIGCSACSILCPVFAIEGEKGEMFQIREKRCVECGVCSRVCPKSAIVNGEGVVPEKLNRKFWPKPAIDKRSCSACGICIYWCTPGALSISMPEFLGDINVFAVLSDMKKCVGCGLCERHCPLDAVRMVSNEES